jgi:hypothetical protein
VAPAVKVGFDPTTTIWLAGELVNFGGDAALVKMNVNVLLVEDP